MAVCVCVFCTGGVGKAFNWELIDDHVNMCHTHNTLKKKKKLKRALGREGKGQRAGASAWPRVNLCTPLAADDHRSAATLSTFRLRPAWSVVPGNVEYGQFYSIEYLFLWFWNDVTVSEVQIQAASMENTESLEFLLDSSLNRKSDRGGKLQLHGRGGVEVHYAKKKKKVWLYQNRPQIFISDLHRCTEPLQRVNSVHVKSHTWYLMCTFWHMIWPECITSKPAANMHLTPRAQISGITDVRWCPSVNPDGRRTPA